MKIATLYMYVTAITIFNEHVRHFYDSSAAKNRSGDGI
jgi:hypothetical protein